ncbi:hypothetical protein BDA96_04G151700 [Sorghum bicolor]|uniref:Cystatin domain-containing protein n=2 Tax=Sorghum bicolor TaxID=4558 RepID=A0A921UJ35_SORBI|nr:putative cysteine proteinase inhibitor 7 [Sorghum bicolor]EER92057.1 hypothetical protein SORBI_3001G324600 [Sorghum bicolor]KAG0532975.1 hypothetical protein BDA96_04G151700 [Sorghum bicolor]|eukprot:XP_002465059.1 putative cysteine proteinase inhibitor 7 [Sorghum bicolor]
MRTLISMLVVAAAAVVGLCSVAPAASARGEPPVPQAVGGWKPINVNDPHIQELGRWAVSEHGKQASDRLVFGKVVSGEEQIVAGTKYKLVIQATRAGAGGNSATYGAVVYEKVDKTRQLLSFSPAN